MVEADLEVVAERRAGDVTPLDEHDPVERRQLVQRKIVDVARALEPIDVGVVERQPVRQRIAVDERERRRRDRFGDAERTPEALRERGLAGTHVAGQDDHVTGPRDTGDRRRDGVRPGQIVDPSAT